MDRSKKITGIIFAGLIVLAINACKFQAPHYVSLYVDNLTSVNDTATYPGEESLSIVDTTAVINTEPSDDLRPAKEIVKVYPNSVYQHEVKKLLEDITDSIQLLCNQVNELKKHTDLEADTVYVIKEIVSQFKGDSIQTDYKTTRLLQSQNDIILLLRKQVDELKKSAGMKADTVYVIRAAEPVPENRQTDHNILQQLKAQDEQINMLQNQLNSLQNAAARTTQPSHIIREPSQVQPVANQRPDQLTLQIFQLQNDTIQFLRTQLRNLQLQPHKRDTVYIEKEAKELQPVKEIVTQHKATDLQPLQDTISLLKTRVLNLEKQTLINKDTTAPAKQVEKDVPSTAITDTTLLVAYYEIGEMQPLEEEAILQQIKELCKDKSVIKITLSGYTDSSGNEDFNQEITKRRLNYLLEKITPWVAKEKVYVQNFGDTFASDVVVKNERRIEIRIHAK